MDYILFASVIKSFFYKRLSTLKNTPKDKNLGLDENYLVTKIDKKLSKIGVVIVVEKLLKFLYKKVLATLNPI